MAEEVDWLGAGPLLCARAAEQLYHSPSQEPDHHHSYQKIRKTKKGRGGRETHVEAKPYVNHACSTLFMPISRTTYCHFFIHLLLHVKFKTVKIEIHAQKKEAG